MLTALPRCSVELPGHTKHNKGITCARCTLNTRLKHLRKATGIYLTVERPVLPCPGRLITLGPGLGPVREPEVVNT